MHRKEKNQPAAGCKGDSVMPKLGRASEDTVAGHKGDSAQAAKCGRIKRMRNEEDDMAKEKRQERRPQNKNTGKVWARVGAISLAALMVMGVVMMFVQSLAY